MTGPKRILQVVYAMGRGGIETWLMNILRNLDRRTLQMDFAVYSTHECAFDQEIVALGSRMFHCVAPTHGMQHASDFRRILTTEGPFDAVHAHGEQDVGLTLMLAAHAGTPIRIAHSHNAVPRGRRRLRSYLYRPVLGSMMTRFMTVGLGCSEFACDELFGKNWRSDPRCSPLYYGFDWDPFHKAWDVGSLRRELGLPENALVVGHVGRIVHQKNHEFFAAIARCISQTRPDAYFLIVGDGALRKQTEEQFEKYGLASRTIFAGERADIARMLQAMDVFLFPSFHEGLGIAIVEAQAVGLPCVISDCIPGEAVVVEGQVTQISLTQSANAWAEKVLEVAKGNRQDNHEQAWRCVNSSRFSLAQTIQTLTEIYTGSGVGLSSQSV